MSGKSYPVSPGWTERAYIDRAKYQELYAWSVADPESFWADQARRIDWIKTGRPDYCRRFDSQPN
jgi:acetyl-CoA synthetase